MHLDSRSGSPPVVLRRHETDHVDVQRVHTVHAVVDVDEALGREIRFDAAPDPGWVRDPLPDATDQLRAYFAGSLARFELRLAPRGTPFQRGVWDALTEIPYGTTTSYGALAARIGRPGASRAVGAANGRNPLPVVIPCHRVIGADGTLTGYGGGLERKQALLGLERAQRPLFA